MALESNVGSIHHAAIPDSSFLHALAGLPPVQNDYDPALGQAADALAKRWHTSDLMSLGSKVGPSNASPDDIKGWSSEMLVAFLDTLANYRTHQPMHKKTTRRMNDLYGLDNSKNAEIRGSWYKLAINAGEKPAELRCACCCVAHGLLQQHLLAGLLCACCCVAHALLQQHLPASCEAQLACFSLLLLVLIFQSLFRLCCSIFCRKSAIALPSTAVTKQLFVL